MANDFLPFAGAGGSNVISQADWAGLPYRLSGYVSGVAHSAQINKGLRQSAAMAAMIGQYIDTVGGLDALDDSDIDALMDNFIATIRSQKPNYVVVGGTANALTATLDPVPASYADLVGVPLRLVIAAPNTGAMTLNVNGLGLKSVVHMDGTAMMLGDVLTGMIVTVIYDGTSFRLAGVAYSEVFRRLTSNLTVYVATTGSDSNPGTAGAPFATLQRAYQYLLTLNLNGFTATVNVADGTYAPLSARGLILGQPSTVYFVGNIASPGNVLITGAESSFAAHYGAVIGVKGFKVVSTGSATSTQGYGLLAASGSQIRYANMEFGACALAQVHSNGGITAAEGNCTISAGSGYFVLTSFGGQHQFSNETNTLLGTPNFSNAFVRAEYQSRILATASPVFSGAATGMRYTGNYMGLINTGGGGANFFPGSLAGSVSTINGAVYA